MKPLSMFKLAFLFAVLAIGTLAMSCGGNDKPSGGSSSSSSTSASKPTFPAGSTMDTIVKRGQIVIGVKYDVPMFGLPDPPTRKVDGLDVAFGKAIAAELGLNDSQIEFVEAISANRIPYLQEDKADFVITTMRINPERKTQIEFSPPYYLAGQSILVMKSNNSITKVDDLNG